jgi:hypothetical protein
MITAAAFQKKKLTMEGRWTCRYERKSHLYGSFCIEGEKAKTKIAVTIPINKQ